MDERSNEYHDDFNGAPVRPVRMVLRGRGLPPPPLAPLVGVFGIIAGLVLGLALAPGPGPTPTPGPVETATISPTGQPQVTPLAVVAHSDTAVAAASPPTDGLSLAQALRAFSRAGTGIPVNDVISAQLTRVGDLMSTSWSAPAGTQWVWALTVRLPQFSLASRGPEARWNPALATPADAGGLCTGDETELVVLDYYSGANLPAYTQRS